MNELVRFRAPWGRPLVAISLLTTAVMVGVSVLCLALLPPSQSLARLAAAGAPPVIVLGCLPFLVRGYTVTGRELRIERLGWSTRWPLAMFSGGLVDPEAMKGSLRLCGNGGLFAFCGWFRNKKLGVYRAFATDLRRSVVLRFGARTVVVTPDDPQQFLAEVNRRRAALL